MRTKNFIICATLALTSLLLTACQSHKATNRKDSLGGMTKADSNMTKTDLSPDSEKRIGDTLGPGTRKSSPASGMGSKK